MSIGTNETKCFHFPFNRSSPNWVGTFMGRSHRSSSKETLKGQRSRSQGSNYKKITLWPFWPLSSPWISTKMGLTIQCHILQIILHGWLEVKSQGHRGQITKITPWPFWPLSSLWIWVIPWIRGTKVLHCTQISELIIFHIWCLIHIAICAVNQAIYV